MTNILQVLLGLALVNYVLFDVIEVAAKPTAKSPQLRQAMFVAGTTVAAFLPAIVLATLLEQFVLSRVMNGLVSTLVFIVTLTAVLHGIAIVLVKRTLLRVPTMTMFLILIFINCVVLGVTMPPDGNDVTNVNDVLLASLARCAGFALVLPCFTALVERLRGADIPIALRGTPATLLTAALLSMTFMGVAGLA